MFHGQRRVPYRKKQWKIRDLFLVGIVRKFTEKVRMSHGGQMPDSNTPMEDFCLAINYATSSTKENPIVEVSMQIGGETITQEINISEVNPRKATQVENMYLYM